MSLSAEGDTAENLGQAMRAAMQSSPRIMPAVRQTQGTASSRFGHIFRTRALVLIKKDSSTLIFMVIMLSFRGILADHQRLRLVMQTLTETLTEQNKNSLVLPNAIKCK